MYKLRQLSLSQFVYSLSPEPPIFTFPKYICFVLKRIQTETNEVVTVCIFFSLFEGIRGDKNQIFRTLVDGEDEQTVGHGMDREDIYYIKEVLT